MEKKEREWKTEWDKGINLHGGLVLAGLFQLTKDLPRDDTGLLDIEDLENLMNKKEFDVFISLIYCVVRYYPGSVDKAIDVIGCNPDGSLGKYLSSTLDVIYDPKLEELGHASSDDPALVSKDIKDEIKRRIKNY